MVKQYEDIIYSCAVLKSKTRFQWLSLC